MGSSGEGEKNEKKRRYIPLWEVPFTAVLVYWLIRGYDTEQIATRLQRLQRFAKRLDQFTSQRD